MKQVIKKRIDALRNELTLRSIAAFIIPSTDPHLSEYVAPYWKIREWISGFNGSAGTVVILNNEAGLWTDSRYFIQAAEQLQETGISLYKEMIPGNPTITEYLCNHLNPGDTVGIDGRMFSAEQVENYKKALWKHSIDIVDCNDIIDQIWKDRPELPLTPPFIHDMAHAGVSSIEKIAMIRAILEKEQIDALFVSTLDEIAWTLNLRGNDIKCNPLFISYLYISDHKTILFIDPEKINHELAVYLKDINISCIPYSETMQFIREIENKKIWMQPSKTNYSVFSTVSSCTIIRKDSPIALLKSLRNPIEQEGIRNAMQKDGVAMVRFLHWLDDAIKTNQETELSVSAKLEEFRSQEELFIGTSFDTIAGYQEHGAIVHYSATPESDATLKPAGFLLLDSGAQYLDGTTDITRTIALGELTDEQKIDYTLVLKGHINLAMAIFPAGTRGAQLDVLARMPLWQHYMNYLHGTGHGVGHFLNVHEGPQSIRMNENPTTLQLGMVTSNEPGVYKDGKYGIRIENLILVCEAGQGMYGDYYRFETLTLCPICLKGVVEELLTKSEIEWLNNYHQTVFESLACKLNEEELAWLRKATQPINYK